MSWISGDYEVDEKPAPPGSLAPPPPAVRREMLRLELEAQVANLQAEAGAMAAEDAVESGTTIEETDIGAALAAVNAAARTEAALGDHPVADPAEAAVTAEEASTAPAGDDATPASEDRPPA